MFVKVFASTTLGYASRDHAYRSRHSASPVGMIAFFVFTRSINFIVTLSQIILSKNIPSVAVFEDNCAGTRNLICPKLLERAPPEHVPDR